MMNTLFDFYDELSEQEKDQLENEHNWEEHWIDKGMPEFVQKDNPPYKTIYLHFRNEEDYKSFAKLVKQNLTNKTKSIWYPKLEIDDNMLKRWIEEK